MRSRAALLMGAGLVCAALGLLLYVSQREVGPSDARSAEQDTKSKPRTTSVHENGTPRRAISFRSRPTTPRNAEASGAERTEADEGSDVSKRERVRAQRAERIDDAFRAQPRDSGWADSTEDAALQRLMAEEGTVPVKVACRTNICRVDVDFHDAVRREEVVERLVPLEPFAHHALWYRYPNDPDNRMTIFFTREGASLPF